MDKNYDNIIDSLPLAGKAQLKTYAHQHSPSYLPQALVNNLTTDGLPALGLALLPLAASFSVAPVSKFYVGAVAFDSAGNAYLGANFEFAHTHIGQTLHAEQSAIANAWAHGARDLALLAINYAPCGHCRQFIQETNISADFVIQLPELPPKPLADFLPYAFGPKDLDISARILGTPSTVARDNTDGARAKKGKDALLNTATIAHGHSHAPYSGNRCGVAIAYSDGQISTGYYGENAAFNPSLPALQMALNQRRLADGDFATIKRAVMVESPTRISQRQNAEQLLGSFCAVALEHHVIDSAHPAF